jgi:hypothetical protein
VRDIAKGSKTSSLIERYKVVRILAGVNQTNRSGHSPKIQMFSLDHHGEKLDDLFCRERLLYDQPAQHGIAHA